MQNAFKQSLREKEKEMIFLKKFQPKTLGEFRGNPEVVEIIKHLMHINSILILVCGPQCSGKSIFVKTVVREYYGTTSESDDNNVLTINSLQDHGISYYRTEVKTFCQTSSSRRDKKKIVLLDDIDLINEQSQQVFRNCIDRYNGNVHFIASCSNIQKVIESLQSRFLIIKLSPLQLPELRSLMNTVIEEECIPLSETEKDTLLCISNKNVKTMLNYLEKIKLYGAQPKELSEMCTNIPLQTIQEYTDALVEGNTRRAMTIIYSIYDLGFSVMDILDCFFEYIKMSTTLTDEVKYKIIPIICKYITIFHNIHEDDIELAIFTNSLSFLSS